MNSKYPLAGECLCCTLLASVTNEWIVHQSAGCCRFVCSPFLFFFFNCDSQPSDPVINACQRHGNLDNNKKIRSIWCWALSHALMYAQRTSVDRVIDALVYFAAGKIDRRYRHTHKKRAYLISVKTANGLNRTLGFLFSFWFFVVLLSSINLMCFSSRHETRTHLTIVAISSRWLVKQICHRFSLVLFFNRLRGSRDLFYARQSGNRIHK